jgi:hypothetical protein
MNDRRFPTGSHPDAPYSEKLMIPEQENLTRPGLHPEIEYGHAGGINSPFIPPVDNLVDMAIFAAPYKRNRFLRSLIFVASGNRDAFEFHLPTFCMLSGYYFFGLLFSMKLARLRKKMSRLRPHPTCIMSDNFPEGCLYGCLISKFLSKNDRKAK